MIKVARATFNYKNSFTWTCKCFIIVNHDSLRKKKSPNHTSRKKYRGPFDYTRGIWRSNIVHSLFVFLFCSFFDLLCCEQVT